MELKKYFIGSYEVGKWDCWTLVVDIYKDMHNIELPLIPYTAKNQKDIEDYVFTNLIIDEVKTPEAGCIFFIKESGKHHVGYCLNNKQMIHRRERGTLIEDIPNKIGKIYKIKKVINNE